MRKLILMSLIGLAGCSWQLKNSQNRIVRGEELEPGLGNHYHPTSTKNAKAQRLFDQGLTLSYAFNHEAALRAFKKAYELDPEFAMAHWGAAMVLGPNYNMDVTPENEKLAYEEVQKAVELSKNVPAQEKDYI